MNLDFPNHHKEHEGARRLMQNFFDSLLCALRELRGKNLYMPQNSCCCLLKKSFTHVIEHGGLR